jgi:hypothetical protein
MVFIGNALDFAMTNCDGIPFFFTATALVLSPTLPCPTGVHPLLTPIATINLIHVSGSCGIWQNETV